MQAEPVTKAADYGAKKRRQLENSKGDEERRLKEAKTAETVLADQLAGAVVEDVDQHVLFGMTGEKTRKNLDEFFLVGGADSHEAYSHV